MGAFENAYAELNTAQKQAVDTIDGPLLVIAGPGTGKTQLLSARVANILKRTDALPESILCLTFTESAALTMRRRLQSMIGEDAYDVHIATYHSFGSDIIRTYPEYFTAIDLETGEDSRLERPIDDLTKTQIVSGLVDKLPFDDPLRGARYYIKSVVSTIAELKKSLITPAALKDLAQQNIATVQQLSPVVNEVLSNLTSTRKYQETFQAFSALEHALSATEQDQDGLAKLAHTELTDALEVASSTNKTSSLTQWKNSWLSKDDTDAWVFTTAEQHLRMLSLANVYQQYQQKLTDGALYDFDDMILKTIEAMADNKELLYNLQEKYQYVLLDEFQDTNPAQFAMVQLLANHPVHEGRPNIMAVGDDDQAIYAFQGAEVSNMVKFAKSFRDTAIINLDQNYRSHADIIQVADAVSTQIEDRLHTHFDGVTKQLHAAQKKLPATAHIERHAFRAQANEYSWVGEEIQRLIKKGVPAREIAVLSPRHAQLEQLVPFLNSHGIPVAYEKRENILVAPLVRELKTMAQLVSALANNQTLTADELFPQVLSFDFWENNVGDIWKINWQYSQKQKKQSWAELAADTPILADQVWALLAIANQAGQLPLEYVLDLFMGATAVKLQKDQTYTIPFKSYYFASDQEQTQGYYEAITQLSVLREHLRAHQQNETTLLTVADFLSFFAMYETAEQPLTNSHPLAQAEDAVQLLTVYKAKGAEYEYVFLLSVHDDIWGKKTRSSSNKVSLPANLRHVRYQGSSEDELRRLLFVAVTRAKHGLVLTSHAYRDGGKATEPSKYLQEQRNQAGEQEVGIFPGDKARTIENEQPAAQANEAVALLWQQRHTTITPTLKSLLQERLDNYYMSPTHLNTFIDLEYGGPHEFLLRTLLRFPAAPTLDGEYGNAIHASLDWYQKQAAAPKTAELLDHYSASLQRFYIPADRLEDTDKRGRMALAAYIAARTDMLKGEALSEVDFRKEGSVLGAVRLTGKIDRLEIDRAAKTLRIVDYKTGEAFTTWKKTLKLHKYRQQLYFYKLLLEKSHSFVDYKVLDGRLEFVDPQNHSQGGNIAPPLVLEFNDAEYQQFQLLLSRVWERIQKLDLPDVSKLGSSLSDTIAFEKSLLE